MSQHHPEGSYQGFFGSYNNNSVPRLHISTAEQTEPWNPSQRPRSVQDMREQAYSPATSVHTTKPTPGTMLADRMIYHQSDLSVAHHSLGLNLQSGSSLLTPSYGSSTSNSTTQEDAWSLFNPRSAENRRARGVSRQSNVESPRYPRSELHDKGVVPSDEGYFSVETSQSALGNETDCSSQSFPLEFYSQIENMNVESMVSIAKGVSKVPSDQRSRVSSTRSRKSTNKLIKCDEAGCDKTFKWNSKYKIHQLQHEKPFKCDTPKCKRASEGFATSHDLDRHKKSVHQVDFNNRSYRCVGKNCKNKEKIWPRLDNFKQHVQRMHQDEDETDVIERSKWNPEKRPSLMSQEPVDAHLDANLVLAGMDKSFPFSPTTDNSSPLDLSTKPTHFSGQRRGQRRAPGLSLAQQTQIPLPADVSTDTAPKEPIPQASLPDISYEFSNAPQTKAEQQRIAQRKPAAGSSPSSSVEIGHILKILHQASNSAKRVAKLAENAQSGSDTQSDTDAVILSRHDALQILKFIPRSTDVAQAVPCKAEKSQTTGLKVCPRPGCGYAVNRDCDLRKHMKRHEKPYGCTYPRCHRRFGAKSDWKRHENNKHFQSEVFRCAFELSHGAICGVYSLQKEAFEIHLKTHDVSYPGTAELLNTRSKIGKNFEGSFWCGFCKAIVGLKTKSNEARDERFDHIAEHLEQDNNKKSIEEWICVEQNKTKKELLLEERMQNNDEDEERAKNNDFASARGERDCHNPLPPPPPPLEHGTWAPTDGGLSQLLPLYSGNEDNRKRTAPDNVDDLDPKSKQKRRVSTTTSGYCCFCQGGPCNSLQSSCRDGNHVLCSNCMYNIEEFTTVDSMELY
ncbi:hypothetical protein J3E71DRAFT_194259 [Bipolaris maydis]|nr:hypothetical protein J3E71DRAFT_194259 [Bipolaris maydis]